MPKKHSLHSKAAHLSNEEVPLNEPGQFEARIYRNHFSQDRFASFVVNYKQTDLWIGVDPVSFQEEMKAFSLLKVKELWTLMQEYLANDPVYGTTFEPYRVEQNAPVIVKEMAEASERAGVGPMAAIAGAFAEVVGRAMMDHFDIHELVVENGGDIFMKIEQDILMSVFAGKSPLSEKIGIEIQASESPMGVCTSAGTVGPSVSFGKADAVMIVCKNAALADAFATAFGNQIKSTDDVQQVIGETEKFPEILSAAIICQDKLGIRGKFGMKLIK